MKLKNKSTIIAIICFILGTVSCINNRKAIEERQHVDVLLEEILNTTGDSIMLSSQELTTWEKIWAAFDNGYEIVEDSGDIGDFLHEATPDTKAFFFREPDIKDTELSRTVQLRYNYEAVVNKLNHGIEWYNRIASGVAGGDEDNPITKADTLEWIRESQPDLTDKFIDSCLPTAPSRKWTKKLLKAFRGFDGDGGPSTEVYQVFQQYKKNYDEFPVLVTEDTLKIFEAEFWEWYDKEQFVPGIDSLVKKKMKDYTGEKLSDGQVKRLEMAVRCEKDINKRTILALELIKYDKMYGVPLLGDIIESGIYTRYLLEAWISWRANVQMEYSPSSYNVIIDNYYDLLRVKCLNTFLRHCQEEDDYRARCLMENLIQCENLHRMGSLFGNESYSTCVALSYWEFIHPRLLEK